MMSVASSAESRVDAEMTSFVAFGELLLVLFSFLVLLEAGAVVAVLLLGVLLLLGVSLLPPHADSMEMVNDKTIKRAKVFFIFKSSYIFIIQKARLGFMFSQIYDIFDEPIPHSLWGDYTLWIAILINVRLNYYSIICVFLVQYL